MAEKMWTTLSNEIAQITSDAGQSVVAVLGGRHASSGVVFSGEAVVTANHAVRREDDIPVVTAPGQQTTARVAGRDAGTDLAVLRLKEPIQAPFAAWGMAADLRVGELVLAIGRTARGNLVASAGILSGLIASRWRSWRGGELDQFIRPDLNLYPGFSGGPLLANTGEFLGVNTAGLYRNAITVPGSTVKRIAAELLEKGRIERPYLGLAMQPVTLPESWRTKLNLTASEGLLVAHLEHGGPAEKAGVMLGDILIELGGQTTADTESVQHVLRSRSVGQEIEATVIRAGELARLRIRLQARPLR